VNECIGHDKDISRGGHLKCYSVTAIMLRYNFTLSHDAFILYIIVIASSSYRSECT
jgi:hypothetical protein